MALKRKIIYLGNGNITVIPPPERINGCIKGYRAKFIDWSDCLIKEDSMNDVISSFINKRND